MAARVVLTAFNVSAERRRAAALDRAHHLHLVEADMTAIGITPRGPVITEDVRDFQQWPGTQSVYAIGADGPPFLGRLRVPPKCSSGLSIAAIRPVATRV